MSGQALVPYLAAERASTPKFSVSNPALPCPALPSIATGIDVADAYRKDIRENCTRAQTMIMRLQQATNTQVGLSSSARDAWFDQLKQVAQCFVAANQASSRIEQVVTTEKAQLQGALAAALNERDLANTQREAAQQEVDMLRSRLREQADSAESSKEPVNGL